MSATTERREPIRRAVNSMAMRDGVTQESKLFATVGKCLCIWLIYYHASDLIDHWEVLLVLLSWLIAPDLVKKLLTLKFGGGQIQSFSEHTEITKRDRSIGKVDDPDGMRR